MRLLSPTRYLANLGDHEAPADGNPPKELGAFIRWCLKGSFGVIFTGAAFNGALGLAEVAVVVILGWLVDAAAQSGGLGHAFWDAHWPIVVGWLILLLAIRPLGFGLAAGFQTIAVAPNLFKLTLSRLFRYTLGHAVNFFDNDFAGRIAQKHMQTTRALVDIVTESMNALATAISSALGTALILGAIDPLLGVGMLVWISAYVFYLRYFLPRIRALSAKRAAARAMVTGQVVDTITNIKLVKLFTTSRHEDEGVVGSLGDFRLAGIEWAQIAVLFRIGLVVIAGALPAGLVTYLILGAANGTVTPGEITTAGAMAIRLSHMTGWVSWTLMGIYGNLGEVEDGMRTLTPVHELTDAHDAAILPTTAPSVEFENVTFAYGRDIGGINNISLVVAPGEKLGVVGASGAGKSTLVALMLRLYDAESGAVKIGGVNVKSVTQDSLRDQIGMVTQETAMFNRSARENVTYGRGQASDDAIIAAAKRAAAHEFISGLEDYRGRKGYDAHLGERGVKLSGGQRQRIALARAILKDAPILVLDEATSALDSEIEAEIQTALSKVMEGKTVVAIAHRLSTIAKMDRIIVLDQGQIAEQGTHAELIEVGGLYASYWARQSDGFIGLNEAAE